MTIQTYKFYLEPEDFAKLKSKAESSGFSGRGAISHFLAKVAREELAFLDNNLKSVLSLLKVERKTK